MKQILFVLLVTTHSLVLSQTKIEFERRIPLDSFPEQARKILSVLPPDLKKTRYFEESSGKQKSYEVKFRYNSKHYSIEFSEKGELQDVEINVKKNSINPSLKKTMEEPFETNYTKFRWLKVQEQYNYNGQNTEKRFIQEVLQGQSCCLPFYEIVAEVRKNRSYFLKEYNFNAQGEKLDDRVIDPESYAHVLY